MKTNGNESVYQTKEIIPFGELHRKGLTKRELFAAMAMQGMASNGAFAMQHIRYDSERAVMIADALIAELNKEVQQ